MINLNSQLMHILLLAVYQLTLLVSTTTAAATAPSASHREDENCGKIVPVRNYIFGGKHSMIEQWPWQLHLKIVNKSDDKLESDHAKCGGSLLNDQWIITAGHCFTDQREPNIYLLNGHNYTKHDNYKLIKYDRIIVHPSYKEYSGSHEFSTNDLALIKLSSSNRFKKVYGRPCLPRQDASIPPNSICYITGYGAYHKSDNEQIKRIKEGKVAIKLDKVCIKSLSLSYYDNNTMLCAGRASRSIKANSCQGDSGGPLVCEGSFDDGKPEQWFLFGITSFGALDCSSYHNSVYTRVSNYVDWIYQTMDLYR